MVVVVVVVVVLLLNVLIFNLKRLRVVIVHREEVVLNAFVER